MSEAATGSPPAEEIPVQQRRRGAGRIALLLALALAAAGAGMAAKLAQERSRTLSLAYARQAKEANDRGDHAKALLWALAGLPQPGELQGPDSAEARAELLRAYSNAHPPHVLRGHSSIVMAAAFSPDGKTVLTASSDKTAKLWDAKTGKLLKTLSGHELPVAHAAFDPGGGRVITGSGDETARIWDVKTGSTQIILKGHESVVERVGFSPDGARVFTASFDGTVRLWEAQSGAHIHTLSVYDEGGEDAEGPPDRALNMVEHAEFSPDGSRLVTASTDGIARIWNAQTGKLALKLSGHEFSVEKAIFSSSGDRIATAGWDGTVRLWDAATGEQLCNFEGHGGHVPDMALNAAGDRLATIADDHLVRIFDPDSCKLVRVLAMHPSHPALAVLATSSSHFGSHVKFNPAGTHLLTAAEEVAHLWDVKTGTRLAAFAGHGGDIFDAAFSPDGGQVVTASWDGTARLWSVRPVNLLRILKGHDRESRIEQLVFDPSGKRLASASWDNTVRLWDARTGGLQHVLRGHGDAVRHVAFDASGTRLITASSDGTGRVWNAETGEAVQVLRGEGDPVGTLLMAKLNAEGTQALTVSWENVISIWDVETGQKLHSFTPPGLDIPAVLDAAFTPEGPRALTRNGDGESGTLWNVETGEPVLTLKLSDGFSVIGRFDPSGTHLVTSVRSDTGEDATHIREAGSGKPVMRLHPQRGFYQFHHFDWQERRLLTRQGDMEVGVWDLRTGKLRQMLKGHYGSLYAAGFAGSPDYVFTASADGSAPLWDVRTARVLTDFSERLVEVRRAAINRDGTRIATASGDNRVRLWKVPPVFRAGLRQQVQMACALAARTGVTAFSEDETADPFLPAPPPRPCERSGLLTLRFYEQVVRNWFGN